ncbi:unnamed protein product, partial [Ectocarpus sp. 12 AP-2014]
MRSAEEEVADERRRRAEALSRKKEIRAAAKERGQLAAVALNIAKLSSAGSRFAKPNRPSSAEDAASGARRDSRQQLAAEQRELSSKRV